jgi:hypothetical protein
MEWERREVIDSVLQRFCGDATVATNIKCVLKIYPVSVFLFFRSAGMVNDGGVTGNNNVPRQMVCPQGENNISDIAVNSTGSLLYSAASNIVRVWDLRT